MTTGTSTAPTVTCFEEVDSPLGTFAIAGEGRTVVGVRLPGTWTRAGLPASWVRTPGALSPVAAQLEAYFDGTLERFDLDLVLEGTEFQRSVWRALCDVGYSRTASYRDIATVIGKPKATRAVGLANNRNPIALIVPCHRVIGADGSLTGYGGGLRMKQWLLAHERAVRERAT